jgi:hypothetical protein
MVHVIHLVLDERVVMKNELGSVLQKMVVTLPSVNLEILMKTATSITQDNIQVFLNGTPCRLVNFTDFSSTVVLHLFGNSSSINHPTVQGYIFGAADPVVE